MGCRYTCAHAAALAVMLPRGSRVMAALSPASEWGIDQQLMAATANAVRDVAWLIADPQRRESTRPEPIAPPDPGGEEDGPAMGADEYLAALAAMRGGRGGDRAC